MQFDRLHGIVLLALAALLLAVQSAFILHGIAVREEASTAKSSSPMAPNPPSNTKDDGVNFLPGEIAVVLALLGTSLVVSNRPTRRTNANSATETRTPIPH